ncbi:hypothetical protein FH5T_18330 [Draconibacterium orientale]|uniref:Tetratricopeptide repeat-containing protein n=1 Tax=Draconibacterium orientale TaxID=1168034 RepID=A0ABM5QFF7_9BACT|nr:tetratricopeptide repeat protein [Draconibacterium orientale]AHW62249.1 hypothetical protein FH5T_18330 [Draconibacterium orientale]
MQEQQRLAGNYQNLIEQGDQAIDELLFNEALGLFNQALEIRPNEQYPKTKIAEINGLLAEQRKNQEDQKSYNDAMSEGERMFSKQFFDRALTSFENALSYKPGDIKATRRIEDSKKEMKRILDRMEFDKFIAAADKAYKKEDYPDALSNYEQALELVPDEPRTKKRVEEISEILYALNSFNEFVSQADKQFDAQSYATAKSLYEKANELKAGDKHVQERIAEIAQLIAQQGVDEQYAQVIKQADNLLAQKNYEDARSQYTEALQIKPREQYPKDKLDEIASTLTELARLERQYNDLIAEGDRLFGREDYTDAKSTFAQAAQLKPEESYPPEMMDKIDGLIAENERLAREEAEAEAARLAAIQAEKDKNYNDAIARADELFAAENYEESRNEYRAAQDIKPEELYPPQRIDEIDRILRELAAAQAAQAELDRKYANLIMQADRFFAANSYTPSKENYTEALALKPEETYPKDKIAEIDRILEQRAIDEKYRSVIVVADGHFRTQAYDDARLQYEIALGVKPNEEYPKEQIRKIDAIRENERQQIAQEQANAEDLARRRDQIAQLEEELDEQRILEESGLNALYDQIIKKADGSFDIELYNVSRAWYYKAQDLKPEEAYPPRRIAEINRILGDMMLSERDREYQRFIDLADESFRNNELAVARGWYNQALSQKDTENYPKEQLREIERRVAERVAGQSQQQFENFKTTANSAFEAGNYNVARFYYRKALELRSDDAEVKAKLQEIEALR